MFQLVEYDCMNVDLRFFRFKNLNLVSLDFVIFFCGNFHHLRGINKV